MPTETARPAPKAPRTREPMEVRMTSLRRTALLALFCVAAAPTFVQAQATAEEVLVRRVDSLERRIVELERRIALLENAAQGQSPTTRAATGSSRELANWRRLREGMSYDAVRAILGEP